MHELLGKFLSINLNKGQFSDIKDIDKKDKNFKYWIIYYLVILTLFFLFKIIINNKFFE